MRTLSPLARFLGRWGLRARDENALVNAILATVRENVQRDLQDSGLAGTLSVRILNSRDHADPFGRANVSRLVVGGTTGEVGFETIGVAQSIDPGNFAREESALVLLDLLSAPAGPEFSLNTYLRPASDRIRFVGRAIGNIVAHEAGHYLGNWHVDQFNSVANLMDQGGNFRQMFGVGRDRIGGTRDDRDVDFGVDVLHPIEGFTGRENTLARTFYGLARR